MKDKRKKNDASPVVETPEVAQQETVMDEVIGAEPEAEVVAEVSETEKLTAELADLNQKFLRVAADFENYKRRTALERDDLLKYSNAKLVGDLLPIIDNFQLALKNIEVSAEVQGFLTGMEMIYNQLLQTLEQAGLAKIEAVDQPFDPNKHEAIMQVPDDSVPDDTVLEELRAGYQFKDKVLRASMVKVSSK